MVPPRRAYLRGARVIDTTARTCHEGGGLLEAGLMRAAGWSVLASLVAGLTYGSCRSRLWPKPISLLPRIRMGFCGVENLPGPRSGLSALQQSR